MYKINEINKLAIKTHEGLSQRKTVENIICQGEPWGPIDCSLHIDGIGKLSLDPSLEPYRYKDEVEIPALGWVDDVISVSESGHKTTRINSFINAQLATKKLRLGAKKCFVMHVGNRHEDYKNIELVIDGWSVKRVENIDTGELELEDTYEEDMKEISHTNSENYLGQIISSDSKNTLNILKQRNKGIGIQNKIIHMLEKMPGGHFHFEIAIILRNSLLISSMLSNSEIWYGLTKKDTEMLEQVDEMWMRNLFECSRNVAKDLLYLELGVVPISYLIKARRQMYLHHILQQNEDTLLSRFFFAQLKSPTYNDWSSQVLQEQEELEICLDLEEIKDMSKTKFKSLLLSKIRKKAFQYLVEKKESRISDNSRGKKIKYMSLEMAEYLSPEETDLSIDEKKWLLKCRIEDIDISENGNWNNGTIICKYCHNEAFTQRHLLDCKYLQGKNEILSYIPDYNDLFNGDMKEQIYISRLLKENFNRFKSNKTM